MKHMCIILSAVLLSTVLFSCEKKSDSEKATDRIEEVGDTAKTKVGKAIENESEKTTKNGSDAH